VAYVLFVPAIERRRRILRAGAALIAAAWLLGASASNVGAQEPGAGEVDTAQERANFAGELAAAAVRAVAAGFAGAGERPVDQTIYPADPEAVIERVISRAMARVGDPYVWGGGDAYGPTTGGSGFQRGWDCSGLMLYAFAPEGISLPHYSGYQYLSGTRVPVSQARRGDMLFWGDGGSTHVALYLGGGQMLEAPESGAAVRVSGVRWDGMTTYAVRMVA
jgi:cell wall-associated NlpC family hydrolase